MRERIFTKCFVVLRELLNSIVAFSYIIFHLSVQSMQICLKCRCFQKVAYIWYLQTILKITSGLTWPCLPGMNDWCKDQFGWDDQKKKATPGLLADEASFSPAADVPSNTTVNLYKLGPHYTYKWTQKGPLSMAFYFFFTPASGVLGRLIMT